MRTRDLWMWKRHSTWFDAVGMRMEQGEIALRTLAMTSCQNVSFIRLMHERRKESRVNIINREEKRAMVSPPMRLSEKYEDIVRAINHDNNKYHYTK